MIFEKKSIKFAQKLKELYFFRGVHPKSLKQKMENEQFLFRNEVFYQSLEAIVEMREFFLKRSMPFNAS